MQNPRHIIKFLLALLLLSLLTLEVSEIPQMSISTGCGGPAVAPSANSTAISGPIGFSSDPEDSESCCCPAKALFVDSATILGPFSAAAGL